MKITKYIAIAAMAATLFASCEKQDDDMPRLDRSASKAPVLADLGTNIDNTQDSYTFNFAAGTFVVDGKEVILAEKDKSSQYCIQADIEGGNFENPVEIATQNYDETDRFDIAYENICAKMSEKCGLSESNPTWSGNLLFRLLMLPGSNSVDGIASDPIKVAATLIFATDATYILYTTDTEGDYFVWAWNGDDGGDKYTESGSWPGDQMTLMESNNSKYLYRYEFTVMNDGKAPANIIISTDNGDRKLIDGAAFENHKDYGIQGDEPDEPQDDSNLPQICKATVSGSVITFESDKDLVYYVWAWADGFDQLTESGWPGDKLILVKSDDGVFTYEYDFANAAALPAQFIISTDNDVKFFDGVAFEEGAEYNYDASNVEPTPEPEPLDPDVELSFTFKTDTEGDYFVWAWGGDKGGEVFTEAGVWPGDKMEFVETTEDGKYLYRYTFTKNPGFAPSNIIISTNNGEDKIYDGAEFENGKTYEKPE